MSDMGDTFREWGKIKKAKRASNREQSTKLLTEHNIVFESKNDGAHLIIKRDYGQATIDFWPGTGKWIARSKHRPIRNRGVHSLLKFLGVKV